MSEVDKIIENLKKSGRKVEEFYTGNKTSDKNVGSIDEKAVNDDIELIKNLIENNKIEIKNVSVGQEFRLLRTLQNILAEREQKDKQIKELEEERKRVLDLIFEYGQIDGGHHKMWVIDQIVRILTKDGYNEWVKNYVYDEETGDIYSWDKGIAP